jgi:hypothetical protein
MHKLILMAIVTVTIDPAIAQVRCPSSVPEDPTREQVVACMREFSALQNRFNTLEAQFGETVLKRLEFFTNYGETGAGERKAGCPSGAKLVGGTCFPTGGDFSRPQFGPTFDFDAKNASVICKRYGNDPVQAIAICARPNALSGNK